MKKTYLSVIAATLLLCAGPGLAEADANFTLYSGLPYLNEQVVSDYKHYQSIDWYPDGDQYDDRPDYGDRPNRGQQMSCNQARRLVRDSGYRNVDTKDCSGKIYMFSGRRDGRQVFIYVKARTGETWHN
jgi:hypothetical protein